MCDLPPAFLKTKAVFSWASPPEVWSWQDGMPSWSPRVALLFLLSLLLLPFV